MSTQRKRTRNEDSDEDYGEPSEAPSQRVKTLNPVTDEWEEEEKNRKVKDVVRLILSSEYKRKIIRREDLVKTANDRKLYNIVLAEAKEKLKRVFGFELIELPSIKTNQSATQQLSSSQAHMNSQSTQKRVSSANGYVLRSCLKEEYRTPEIIERSEDEYKMIGVLYTILGLIFLGGQTMTSTELFGHLDHLKITKNRSEFKDREKLLDSFIKNNYLKRVQTSDFEGDEVVFNFSWGPRAMVELGHAGVVEFLTSFYNVSEDEKEGLQRKMWSQAGYSIRDTQEIPRN